MEHDVTPFWADIKKYEEALANDPGSYCFAPLAELYRKTGLLDDAIHVAKKGCDIHPDYVGGYMALGRAYFEKGMREESKAALEKVIATTPDNLLARKILSHIYVDNGENAAAEATLRFLLSFNPADHESRVLLDSLQVSQAPALHAQTEVSGGNAGGESPASGAFVFEFPAEDAEIIEDAEIVEDAEIIEDADLPEEFADAEPHEKGGIVFTPPGNALKAPAEGFFVEEGDPLRTVTMAELYASQGFLKRALTIYRKLLETDPDNAEWNNRLYELKMSIDEDTASARNVATADNAAEIETADVSGQPGLRLPDDTMTSPVAPDESVIGTLEKWLDTIRRRR